MPTRELPLFSSRRICSNTASVGLSRAIRHTRWAWPISQRNPFGRDPQRDDPLRTIGPGIARVTLPARVGRIVRRVGLEVSAGQIVEPHFVVRAEEIAPLVAQRIEEFFLERPPLIPRGVKLVDFGQPEIRAEQIGQRGPLRAAGRCSAKNASRPSGR